MTYSALVSCLDEWCSPALPFEGNPCTLNAKLIALSGSCVASDAELP